MSDRNEIHDLLDGNRRKRSATSTQVLGPAAAAREQFDDSRREPRLPSPTGMIRPEDRPKLPPLQTYLRSCHADVDTCSRPLPSRDADMPWTRDRSNSGANGATLPTLPRIVTSDFPPASRPVPTDPIAYATSKSSYSGSRSTLSSPHSTSPTSYAPPSSYPSAVNASYGRSERDPLRPTPAASDPARSHSLSSTNGESVSGPYEPYAAADRRYSTGYIPPHAQRVHGAPPTSHYATMPPPPHGAEVPAHYVWEMPVAAINPNGRKRRGNLPKESTSILNDWFCQHITFPYPKEDEKHQLQAMTGLSISQVRHNPCSCDASAKHPNQDRKLTFAIDQQLVHQRSPPEAPGGRHAPVSSAI